MLSICIIYIYTIRRPYISDGWNLFDIIVVSLSLVALGPIAMPINVLRSLLYRSIDLSRSTYLSIFISLSLSLSPSPSLPLSLPLALALCCVCVCVCVCDYDPCRRGREWVDWREERRQ